MTAIIVIVVVVILAAWLVSMYNSLVKMRNNRENAFADIDVQLKQRHDLVPQLVETVKGYAAHEKDTLERVINARNGAIGAKTIDEKNCSRECLVFCFEWIENNIGSLSGLESKPKLSSVAGGNSRFGK